MSLPRILVQGDMVFPADEESKPDFQSRFTTAVMDGQLPICAPIGMRLNLHQGMTKELAKLMLDTQESMLSIIRNCTGLAFYNIPNDCRHITSDEQRAGTRITTSSVPWLSMPRQYQAKAIGAEKYLLTTRALLQLQFWVVHLTGYRDVSANNHIMNQARRGQHSVFDSTDYVPLASDHTLNKWLHVSTQPMPVGCRVYYDNGLTPDMLQQIWNEGVDADARVFSFGG